MVELIQSPDDDWWAEAWLARTYGGAPDECSECFRAGALVKTPDCTTHTTEAP